MGCNNSSQAEPIAQPAEPAMTPAQRRRMLARQGDNPLSEEEKRIVSDDPSEWTNPELYGAHMPQLWAYYVAAPQVRGKKRSKPAEETKEGGEQAVEEMKENPGDVVESGGIEEKEPVVAEGGDELKDGSAGAAQDVAVESKDTGYERTATAGFVRPGNMGMASPVNSPKASTLDSDEDSEPTMGRASVNLLATDCCERYMRLLRESIVTDMPKATDEDREVEMQLRMPTALPGKTTSECVRRTAAYFMDRLDRSRCGSITKNEFLYGFAAAHQALFTFGRATNKRNKLLAEVYKMGGKRKRRKKHASNAA